MMKIDVPEPSKETRQLYDGATLIFKELMVKIWGGDQIDKVIECGYLHDHLTARNPDKAQYNRLIFYLKMNKCGVSASLIRIISIFLSIYDALPKWVKYIIDIITKEPHHRNEN